MDTNLEAILQVYEIKVQKNDTKTMDLIKTCVKGRYQLSEEQFQTIYTKYLDTYIKSK